jgi:hypothetical protein
MMIPQDPFILLSWLNMKLRDEYSSLDELCTSFGLERQMLEDKMKSAGFVYDPVANQFR